MKRMVSRKFWYNKLHALEDIHSSTALQVASTRIWHVSFLFTAFKKRQFLHLLQKVRLGYQFGCSLSLRTRHLDFTGYLMVINFKDHALVIHNLLFYLGYLLSYFPRLFHLLFSAFLASHFVVATFPSLVTSSPVSQLKLPCSFVATLSSCWVPYIYQCLLISSTHFSPSF